MNKFLKNMYVLGFLLLCNIASAADASNFKSGFASLMGYVCILSFVACVVVFGFGVYHYINGDPISKYVMGVALCASSSVICGALFAAFGLSDAVLTPTFGS